MIWLVGRLVEECSATGSTKQSDSLGMDTPTEH